MTGCPPSRNPLHPVITFDLSQPLRAEQASASTAAPERRGHIGDVADKQATSVALQLYDLCSPVEDSTITRGRLEKVLRANVGLSRDEDIANVMRLVGGGSGCGSPGDQFDFLSYWQGIDRFFAEAGGVGVPTATGAVAGGDVVSGMRRFRDGVLELAWREGGKGSIDSARLLALLSEIRLFAHSKSYWDEVMRAIPNEDSDGLTVSEISESVCHWLRVALQERGATPSASSSDSGARPAAPADAAAAALARRRPGAAARRPVSDDVPILADDSEDDSGGARGRRSARSANHLSVATAQEASNSSVSPSPLQRSLLLTAEQDRSPSPMPFHRSLSGAARRKTIGAGMGPMVSRHDSTRSTAACTDLEQANDLLEMIGRCVDPGNERVHRALARLSPLHDAIMRLLSKQDEEIHDLRRSNEVMGERRRQAEEELSKAHELVHETSVLANDSEEATRRAAALAQEVAELKDHLADAKQRAARLKAQSVDAERERMDTQRRDWQWRDRCEQLEQAALNAEGQAQFMRTEVEKYKAAAAENESFRRQVQRLRQQLDAARGSIRSYRGVLEESDECVERLRQRADEGAPVAPPPERVAVTPRRSAADAACSQAVAAQASGKSADPSALEKRVESQQVELQKLRIARNALAAAQDRHEKAMARQGSEPEEPPSPRRQQAFRRCQFLGAQVQALLTLCQDLEQMLDAARDARFSGALAPEVKKSLSVQRVFEEGTARFDEVLEELHTIQVQKADADQELRRLQHRVVEQDEKLQEARSRRDELLAELGSTRRSSASQDSFGGRFRNEFYIGDGAASEARSSTSGTPGHAAGSNASTAADVGIFISKASTSYLQPSPKATVQVHRKGGVSVGVHHSKAPIDRGNEDARPRDSDVREHDPPDRVHRRDADGDHHQRERAHRHVVQGYSEDTFKHHRSRHRAEHEGEHLANVGHRDEALSRKASKRTLGTQQRVEGSECGQQ